MQRRSSTTEIQAEVKSDMGSPFVAMDRMYRYQRHIYDVSRKFYLLGRDRLLEEMTIQPGNSVLEVGCGTGRNLISLADRHPKTCFYGLDASQAMLDIARANAESKDISNLLLVRALADDFDRKNDLGASEPLDIVFFSYSISMIPTWRESILKAIEELRPGGRLYIVDFYDQNDLPRVFRNILKQWLRLFGVRYPTGLLRLFDELNQAGLGEFSVTPLYRRYSLIIDFKKS